MKMAAFDAGADRRASPDALAFSAGSSTMPRSSRPAHTAARIDALFSPMPPENVTHVHAAERHEAGAEVVAHRVHEHVERQARAGVARRGAPASRSRTSPLRPLMPARPDWLAEQPGHRVRVEPALLHHEQHGEDVEVADAVVLRQARLRREAEAGLDRHAVADARHARTAAQVAGDVAHAAARSAPARVRTAARWLAPWNP